MLSCYMEQEKQLKPCPFCGGRVRYWNIVGETDYPVPGVVCHSCHMFVKYSDLPKFKGKITIEEIQRAVLNRWNRRKV